MSKTYGPKTDIADRLHATKYRGLGEDFREAMNRVAFALKDTDAHYHEFRDILLNMRFMPGGRIQAAAGSTKRVTSYNCFLSGIIEDSYTDGPGSIMGRAHQAASTMRMGGGIGYDFSTLRPRGSHVAKIDSQSSGPVSFMPIFDAVCLATSSYGHRRGAQMGMLRVDHPDIEEFIGAKQNNTALRGFNISVAVTDAFMEAVEVGGGFDLMWNGRPYKTVDAQALYEKIMRSTYDWAEPGIFFIDRVNEWNNLNYCETIYSSNPCSEQPLPPFGACLLGSFNLVAYLGSPSLAAAESRWHFDFDRFSKDIATVVRAMDNVVDRSIYPLAEQRSEAVTKRRMGLGITGLANAGEALGNDYGSAEFLEFESKVLQILRDESYRASAALAAEKGSFPLFDSDRYLSGKFIKTLSQDVREWIGRYGIRNSHLTSIAPTGTISMCADNVSSSIEPVFAYRNERPVNTPEGQLIEVLEDHGSKFLGVRGKLADKVTAAEHVDVLVTAQKYIDSAVSKTINMDSSMPWEDFKRIYKDVYERGGKGCSTFNRDGNRGALLKKVEETENDGLPSCEIDERGIRSCE